MRISNIHRYLGGADNVVAREVINNDQFTQTINVSGVDFTDLPDTAFDLDYELFTANLTYTGSKVTIDSLVPTAPAKSIEASTSYGDTDPIKLIDNKSSGSFDMLIPNDLLSQFNAGDITYTPTADSNTNVYVVAQSLRWTIDNETRTVRFLWIMRYSPTAS